MNNTLSPHLIHLVHLVVGLLVTAAAVYDLRTLRLPHMLTLSAALTAVPACAYLQGADALAGSLAGFIGLKAVQLICRGRYGRECLGSGDCLLMLSLGALTGLTFLPIALTISLLAVWLTVLILDGKSAKIPFGPFLVLGALPVAIVPTFM